MLLPFPFTDLSAYKLRPALLVTIRPARHNNNFPYFGPYPVAEVDAPQAGYELDFPARLIQYPAAAPPAPAHTSKNQKPPGFAGMLNNINMPSHHATQPKNTVAIQLAV